MTEQQVQNLRRHAADALSLGGDCMGANAVFFALQEVNKGLGAVHGDAAVQQLVNVFGS